MALASVSHSLVSQHCFEPPLSTQLPHSFHFRCINLSLLYAPAFCLTSTSRFTHSGANPFSDHLWSKLSQSSASSTVHSSFARIRLPVMNLQPHTCSKQAPSTFNSDLHQLSATTRFCIVWLITLPRLWVLLKKPFAYLSVHPLRYLLVQASCFSIFPHWL